MRCPSFIMLLSLASGIFVQGRPGKTKIYEEQISSECIKNEINIRTGNCNKFEYVSCSVQNSKKQVGNEKDIKDCDFDISSDSSSDSDMEDGKRRSAVTC
ncbi:hypothetical protein MCOR25_005119 [Pyricularia grisea]|nr:hypothetical protein MCOR25_005119 [Pyricularia grisea]